jgi:hypothetical protein
MQVLRIGPHRAPRQESRGGKGPACLRTIKPDLNYLNLTRTLFEENYFFDRAAVL